MLRVATTDELVVDELWALGATAVTERDGTVDAGFESSEDEARAAAALAPRVPVERVEDEIESWADTWRATAQPTRVGRFLLHPAWLPDPAVQLAGDVVVRVEPGRAFGIGSHPTTRLAIEALAATCRRGDHVLDVGTGTGVLALVAVLGGANRATAMDIDAAAVEVARENARLNGCDETVSVSTTPLDRVRGTFDVVVANLGGLLAPLAAAADLTARATRAVIISGLLDPALPPAPAVDPLDEAMSSHGFDVGGAAVDHGWMARTYISRAGTPARRGR